MRIVTFNKIKDFTEKNSNSDVALSDWYFKTKRSERNTLTEIKQTFNSVDSIGNNRYIFNIKGNHYRLVTSIIFASSKVYIRFIGSYSEYDKIGCSTI